jgi:phosphatidylglycerophosphate synthase
MADRLAIAATIALMVRDVFPVWAGLLIIIRDAAVLVVGLVALRRFHPLGVVSSARSPPSP